MIKHSLETQPGMFTLLAFEMNSMLDNGNFISIAEVKRMCEDYSLIKWLSNKCNHSVNLWDDEAKIVMAEEFCSIASAIDDDNLFVHNNGFALIVAYCLEFIQTPPTRDRAYCDYAEKVLREKGVIE